MFMLSIFEKLHQLGTMIVQLHKAGVDKQIWEVLESLFTVLHTEVEKHHSEHVGQEEE